MPLHHPPGIQELGALPVPEPASAWVLASGLALLIGRRKLTTSWPRSA